MMGRSKIKGYRPGFTIIEVMIFLAVSGVMFLVAASFITDKEAQAEFTQGINAANAEVVTVINNVSNGNYPFPSTVGLDCVADGSSGVTISVTSSPSTSPNCSFIGEVLQPETNRNPDIYTIYTVAGCLFYSSTIQGCIAAPGDVPMSLGQEKPQVVSAMTKTDNWGGGIQITKMIEVQGSSTNPIGAIGLFSSFPVNNSGVLSSGSQPVSIVVFPSALTDSNNQIEAGINSLGASGSTGGVLNSGYVVMCFEGVGNQKNSVGSLSIGSPNGGLQLTTDLQLGQGVSKLC